MSAPADFRWHRFGSLALACLFQNDWRHANGLALGLDICLVHFAHGGLRAAWGDADSYADPGSDFNPLASLSGHRSHEDTSGIGRRSS